MQQQLPGCCLSFQGAGFSLQVHQPHSSVLILQGFFSAGMQRHLELDGASNNLSLQSCPEASEPQLSAVIQAAADKLL